MGSLDSMLSQYNQYRQNTPYSPASVPSTPNRFYDVGSGGFSGRGGVGFDNSQNPNSFFSAVQPPPTNVTAGATSTGTSPFGQGVPNLSPEDAARVSKLLSGLVYSPPLGGYITAAEANDPNSAFVKDYYGRPMTGGDAGANRLAREAYGIVGAAPTRPIGTRALNQLPGYSPSAGPSYNEKLGGPYFGPFTFPGYNPLG